MKKFLFLCSLLLFFISISWAAPNDPFPFFDPNNEGYTQELWAVIKPAKDIYGGVAFLENGNLMVTDCSFNFGENYEFHKTNTYVQNGATLHQLVTVHSFSKQLGCGLVNHPDGNIYGSGSGLVGFSANDLTEVSLPSGTSGRLGLAVQPGTGRIFRVLNNNLNIGYYDPSTNTFVDNWYVPPSSAVLIDGIFWNAEGTFLYLSARQPGVYEIAADGTFSRLFSMNQVPDGIAFASETKLIFTANVDGTISRFDPSEPNPSEFLFASGGGYGDISGVGPDGCWYVTQNGARFPDGTFDSGAASIVKICGGFAPPPGSPPQGCETEWEAKVNGVTYPLSAFSIDSSDVADYYSYGTPDAASSNSGLEDDNSGKTLVILVRTNDDKNHLVVIHDKPKDGSGGRAVTYVSHTGGLSGAAYEVKDDPGESYVTTSTSFTSTHVWDPCCTDGFALGPIPDFACFNVEVRATTQISFVRLASSAFQDGTAVEIPKENSNTILIEICNSQVCPPPKETPKCPYFDTCKSDIELANSTYDFRNFDVISFGDFSAETGDIQGRLAVRNQATIGSGFTVGDQLQTDKNTSDDTPLPFSLVVGGDATYLSGRVYPDTLSNSGPEEFIFVGGQLTTNQQNGIGDKKTGTCESSGCLDEFFDGARNCYEDLSKNLCNLESNVNKEFKYSGLFLECDSSSESYVVDLKASDFANFQWYSLSNCKFGNQWVINIEVEENSNFDIAGDLIPAAPGTVVYNFCPKVPRKGGKVTIKNALNGNVFGPYTTITQEDGVIFGKVIAGSFEGPGQVQVNRPCAEFPVLVQGAIVRLLDEKEKRSLGERTRRAVSSSIIEVAAFSNIVSGDQVTIEGNSASYTVAARYTDGGKFFLGIEPAITSSVSEGNKLSTEVSPPYNPRYNINKNGFLPEGDIQENTRSSASTLSIGFAVLFLALFFF